MNGKVVIGISGGVDSSVAAYLLKKEGFDVTGVYFNLWGSVDGGRYAHESKAHEEDARRVAERIGIDFMVKNHEKAFKEEVIGDFIREYLAGRTPNPCVRCNRLVKFKYLRQAALEMGADSIATGHYVQVVHDKATGRHWVRRTDNRKDQSYMFYSLSQAVLSMLVMPLGEMKDKQAVREIAEELGLSTAQKKDSQEICFIRDNDYGAFIKRHLRTPVEGGDFIDADGGIIGKHKGIPFYTIGQRKGLGIALGKPVYVQNIDVDSNNIMLTGQEALFSDRLIARSVNGVKYERIPEAIEYEAKTRYTAKPAKARVKHLGDGRMEVLFNQRQRAVTPGQSVVLYEGADLAGGGVIEKTFG